MNDTYSHVAGSYVVGKVPRFSYGEASREKFNERHAVQGSFVSRKWNHLKIVGEGSLNLIGDVFIFIFLSIPGSVHKNAFSLVRDVEIISGGVLSIFHERLGSFHVEQGRFQKQAYALNGASDDVLFKSAAKSLVVRHRNSFALGQFEPIKKEINELFDSKIHLAKIRYEVMIECGQQQLAHRGIDFFEDLIFDFWVENEFAYPTDEVRDAALDLYLANQMVDRAITLEQNYGLNAVGLFKLGCALIDLYRESEVPKEEFWYWRDRSQLNFDFAKYALSKGKHDLALAYLKRVNWHRIEKNCEDLIFPLSDHFIQTERFPQACKVLDLASSQIDFEELRHRYALILKGCLRKGDLKGAEDQLHNIEILKTDSEEVKSFIFSFYVEMASAYCRKNDVHRVVMYLKFSNFSYEFIDINQKTESLKILWNGALAVLCEYMKIRRIEPSHERIFDIIRYLVPLEITNRDQVLTVFSQELEQRYKALQIRND